MRPGELWVGSQWASRDIEGISKRFKTILGVSGGLHWVLEGFSGTLCGIIGFQVSIRIGFKDISAGLKDLRGLRRVPGDFKGHYWQPHRDI